MSIVAPVSSVIWRITEPPLPMTSRIFSGSILNAMMVGAQSDIFSRGFASTEFISSRMCSRASRACSSASYMISRVIPSILMSICKRGDAIAVSRPP
jgi:hypothetical protein